jgi:hypothetical protein
VQASGVGVTEFEEKVWKPAQKLQNLEGKIRFWLDF